MDDFNNKELISVHTKNGFTVRTYREKMSNEERKYKYTQIKYDILNLAGQLLLKQNN